MYHYEKLTLIKNGTKYTRIPKLELCACITHKNKYLNFSNIPLQINLQDRYELNNFCLIKKYAPHLVKQSTNKSLFFSFEFNVFIIIYILFKKFVFYVELK